MMILEVLTGVCLLGTTLLPHQNYELMWWLCGGMGGLWAAAFILTRSRLLASSSVFFHFSYIVAFTLRATMTQGWMYRWFLAIALVQWCVLLWFAVRSSEDRAAPSVFLAITTLSPLFAAFLSAWSTWVGISLWSVLILRIVLLNELSLSRIAALFLLVCFASIPFSLYPGRSLQFLLLNCVCVLAMAAVKDTDRRAMLSGYIFIGVSLIIFVFSREFTAFQTVGPTLLRMRLSAILYHNDLVPLLILTPAMLLHLWPECYSKASMIALGSLMLFLAFMLALTSSRAGFACYALFLITYVGLRWRQGKHSTTRADHHIRASAIAGAALVVFALVLFLVDRQSAIERLADSSTLGLRTTSWKAGIQTVGRYPLFGIGYLNYYAHGALAPPPPVLSNLQANHTSLSIQTHSVFLDLAEASGIPLALLFGVLLFCAGKHSLQKPALAAALAALFLNCVFDSAAMHIGTYPHLWLLLGMFLPPSRWTLSKPQRQLIGLFFFVVGFLLNVVGDHLLQRGSIALRNNRIESGYRNLQLAALVTPLDVAPLEMLKDLYLSRKDVRAAVKTLGKLQELKKHYAPYHCELGRIQMAIGDMSGSKKSLERALQLDPYSGQKAPLFPVLALLALKNGDEKAFLDYTVVSLIFSTSDGSAMQVRPLLEKIDDIALTEAVERFLKRNDFSQKDWDYVFWGLVEKLQVLERKAMQEAFLERALLNRKGLEQETVDYICDMLAGIYAADGRKDELPPLIPLSSPDAAHRIRARIFMTEGRYTEGEKELRLSLSFYRFPETVSDWEQLYRGLRQPDKLRQIYETMERLPSVEFTADWRRRIARSYVDEGNYEAAAREYHHLSFFSYEDPEPHWYQSRCWWLAGNKDKAEAANRRLQRQVPTNVLLQNLYRSELQADTFESVRIIRSQLSNSLGGQEWRTGIFAHPDSYIKLPPDIRFRYIRGEAALIAGAWYRDTDGVVFALLNANDKELFSTTCDPKRNTAQRRWNPFEWTSKMVSENIVLTTLPRGDSRYDWSMWAIEDAE